MPPAAPAVTVRTGLLEGEVLIYGLLSEPSEWGDIAGSQSVASILWEPPFWYAVACIQSSSVPYHCAAFGNTCVALSILPLYAVDSNPYLTESL